MIRFRCDHLGPELAGLERSMLGAIRVALREGAGYARELARQTATFRNRTGALRGSIQRIELHEWHQRVRAGNRAVRYAIFVEDGTRPHRIEARRARFLRFVQAGQVRFRRRVQHPGTKPTHFMRDARDQAEVATMRFVEAGIRAAIQ